MAITAQGDRLTQAHRQAQLQIRATVLRQLVQVWPMLDPVRLDQTSPAFLAAATRLVLGGRQLSARASMLYLQQFRAAEGVRGAAPIVLDRPSGDAIDAIRTSIAVTGPVSIKKAASVGTLSTLAAQTAFSKVSAAAARHVLDGGREVVISSVDMDPDARGWARVASANACAFCAMLAGRGGVYTEVSADFAAHDGCGCVVEPVFTNGKYNFPPNTEDYRGVWDNAVRGEFGDEYARENPEWAAKLRDERNAQKRTSLLVNGPVRAYLAQQRAN